LKAILDSGALIAVERRDRLAGARLRLLQMRGVPLVTSAGAVAEVWKDGARQGMLARLIAGVRVAALDEEGAWAVGALLGRSGTRDVVDAHVALLASDADHVLTSDPSDISRLMETRGIRVSITHV